jgi:hypothetical protein
MRPLQLFIVLVSFSLCFGCEARSANANEVAPTALPPAEPQRVEVPAAEPPPAVVQPPPAAVDADAMKLAQSSAETRLEGLRQSVVVTRDAIEKLGDAASEELKQAGLDLGQRWTEVEQRGAELRAATSETWRTLEQQLTTSADQLDAAIVAARAKLPPV